MEIKTRRHTFSQFLDDLSIIVSDDGAVFYADISQSELIAFALSLLDVADDCLIKSTADTEGAREALSTAWDAINMVAQEQKKE